LAITNTLIDAWPKGIENEKGKLLVARRAMREGCTSRHMGPFSIGIHRTGQFRCENCDTVLSGVEVYLDTTEHAADGKRAQGALKFAEVPIDAIPPKRAVSALERVGSMS
jgi:hypothetical protein